MGTLIFRLLANEIVYERLVGFLLDSPLRYEWFGRRFVVMPDHLHLIAAFPGLVPPDSIS